MPPIIILGQANFMVKRSCCTERSLAKLIDIQNDGNQHPIVLLSLNIGAESVHTEVLVCAPASVLSLARA